MGDQVLDDQRARSNLVEHRAEGALAGVGAEQVVDLDQDRGGDDTPLARRLGEQLRAALVRLVVAVEGADQDGRVEDQRDGRGSKTSSAASLLRSPRPELNAPMQVSGGCSPSSFALERLSLPAPASSCSSASRTSSGTSTPRSRAARCARSRRSVSILMLVLAVEAIARRLASGSINKTIKGLAWFLGFAVQYKGLSGNAAAGKERLLKARRKPPVHLDTAEQIEALLDAAAELDRDPGHLCEEREAIVGTLIFAGGCRVCEVAARCPRLGFF